MNINQYSVLALRTAATATQLEDLQHAAMGIGGEAGEVVDIVKKIVFYKKPIDRQHLLEECGDLIWYANLMIHALESNWEEVLEANIRKLEARYPNLRFDAEHALNRNKDAEQEALNKVL